MIVYQSRFLTRGEVWFDDEPDASKVDWILYHQRSRPVPAARWRYFYTRLIDLTASPEELFGQMSKDTAFKIRRARDRDKVQCEWRDPCDPCVLDEFVEVHDRFAALKGLPPLDRRGLSSMAASGALGISVAKDAQGRPLVYHGHYRNSLRTCCLYSASKYLELDSSAARNAIGRANRFLYWSEMLQAREQGKKYFDFCGWYPGDSDPALLKINQFKKGFGGEVVREYECEQICTRWGWVVLKIAGLLRHGRDLAVAWKRIYEKDLSAGPSTEALGSALSAKH